MIYRESNRSIEMFEQNEEHLVLRNSLQLLKKSNRIKTLRGTIQYLLQYSGDFQDYHSLPHILPDERYEVGKTYEVDHLPSVVVYTCITGPYDRLHDPIWTADNLSYVAITSFDLPAESKWTHKSIEDIADVLPAGLDNAQINRWVKMHPYELFPDAEYSIYIDGNVSVMADVMPLVLDMMQAGKGFGIHRHVWRDDLRAEELAVIEAKRIKDEELLRQQVDAYYQSGYHDDIPMLEATILLRRHRDAIWPRVMDAWWQEYQKYPTRDQISLPYVIWKHGLHLEDIHILGHNEYLNPRFLIHVHKK